MEKPRRSRRTTQSPFESVRRDTLANRVYEQLRAAIVSGTLEDGAELNQVDLAEQFEVSRVPVREALLRLEAETLVVAKPFQRYAVSSLTPVEVLELMDVREELEAFALRRISDPAVRAEIDLTNLRAAAGRLSPKHGLTAWVEGDRTFHRMLCSHQPMTSKLVDGIRIQIHRYTRRAIGTSERRRQAIEEHAAILDAIEAGDESSAEALLRMHIRGTRTLLQRTLEADLVPERPPESSVV